MVCADEWGFICQMRSEFFRFRAYTPKPILLVLVLLDRVRFC